MMLPSLDSLVAAAADKALELDSSRRSAILHVLLDWVARHSKPAPQSDLVALERFNRMVEKFMSDVGRLVNEGIELHFDLGGSIRVDLKGTGYESTLILLKRGTSWFEGCHDIDALIASAIF